MCSLTQITKILCGKVVPELSLTLLTNSPNPNKLGQNVIKITWLNRSHNHM